MSQKQAPDPSSDNRSSSVSADKTPNFWRVDRIIRPIAEAAHTFDSEWKSLERLLTTIAEGTGAAVDLQPDFQRGHVWTVEQQTRYIEGVLRGLVGEAGITISFNAPAWTNDVTGDLRPTVVCLDGLQRLTAVRRFLAGEIQPFGLTLSDLAGTRYDAWRPNSRICRFKVAIYTFQARADLLRFYLDLNGGGTPHAEEELDRVRKLLMATQSEEEIKPCA